MKKSTLQSRLLYQLLAITSLLPAAIALAGADYYDYKAAPPTIIQSEPWHLSISAPGWMASMIGTVGLRGVNADVDVGFDQIVSHLDMIFAMRAEASKGPLGMFGEFIYMSLGDDTEVNGLIEKVDVRLDQYFADGALSWRVLNQSRLWLDLAAGTHYTNLYQRMTLHPDTLAISQASEQFVNNITTELRDRLNHAISNSEFLADLKSAIREDIGSRIDNSLGGEQTDPTIPIAPLGGRVRERISQLVQNIIQAKKAALEARIDALGLKGAARRAAVQKAVNSAKARITQQVAQSLQARLSQTFARTDYWFDPYIGLRGRYNFNKVFYTTVRSQIGGFGAGSDLMWQADGVIGINLTRCIFTEVSYWALSVDYEKDGLLFDTITHGPQITTGITF